MKGTALLQVLWLVIQLITRVSQDLPISNLEIAVLAYSASAFCTYTFSWSKPQNIASPTFISSPTPIPEGVLSALIPRLRLLGGYTGARVSSYFLDAPPNRRIQAHTPNDIEYNIRPEVGTGRGLPFLYHFVGMGFMGTIFGVIHCLAWNFYLPSRTEAWLWRLASSYTTTWVPLYIVNYALYLALRPIAPPKVLWLSQFVEVVLFFYICLCEACAVDFAVSESVFLTCGAVRGDAGKGLFAYAVNEEIIVML